eukprot:TRINITY_DN8502_c0_g1_i6.p1 TRINITY_DN8502_c0_g1~~TRINITY_DN8502_c0_g1_i6.p1  ORF type:complete len:678 (-),score=190.98 TRINITY_DN8502_c0_g1_i6:108-2141(-)
MLSAFHPPQSGALPRFNLQIPANSKPNGCVSASIPRNSCKQCVNFLDAAEEHEMKLGILLGEWRLIITQLQGKDASKLARAEFRMAELWKKKKAAEEEVAEISREFAEAEILARMIFDAKGGQLSCDAGKSFRERASSDTSSVKIQVESTNVNRGVAKQERTTDSFAAVSADVVATQKAFAEKLSAIEADKVAAEARLVKLENDALAEKAAAVKAAVDAAEAAVKAAEEAAKLTLAKAESEAAAERASAVKAAVEAAEKDAALEKAAAVKAAVEAADERAEIAKVKLAALEKDSAAEKAAAVKAAVEAAERAAAVEREAAVNAAVEVVEERAETARVRFSTEKEAAAVEKAAALKVAVEAAEERAEIARARLATMENDSVAEKAAAVKAAVEAAERVAAVEREAAMKAAVEAAEERAEIARVRLATVENVSAAETAAAVKAAVEAAEKEAAAERDAAVKAAVEAVEKEARTTAPRLEAAETTESSRDQSPPRPGLSRRSSVIERDIDESVRTVFALCDVDGEHSVTVRKFADMCAKFSYIADFCNVEMAGGDVSMEHLELVMGKPGDRMDFDTFKERIITLRQTGGGFMNEDLKLMTIYNVIDVDNGGSISLHELVAFVTKHPKIAEMAGIRRVQNTGAALKRTPTDQVFSQMAEGGRVVSRDQFINYIRKTAILSS